MNNTNQDEKEIVIVSAVRTPIGKFLGSLSSIPAGKMGALVIEAALARTQVKKEEVNEVIMGNVLSAGSGMNVARQAAIYAGLSDAIPAHRVDMVCGSGMMSIIQAVRSILCGDAEIVVAGGVENMSGTPYLLPRAREGYKMGHSQVLDSMIHDGLTDIFNNIHMGIVAENIAEQFGITRTQQDEYAQKSQEKTKAAIQSGRFDEEILPVQVQQKKTSFILQQDEFPRFDTTLEDLEGLKPAFKQNGTVTAGNSSGVNDGAAAIVITSKRHAKELRLQPLAVIKAWATAGVDPAFMGLGPIPATRKALKKAGLSIEQIDLIESNEAFAAQCLAVAKELQFDEEKVNVNGGAIALGHPIGASGARITVTLVHEMLKRNANHGLATLCIGGGMGSALILSRTN